MRLAPYWRHDVPPCKMPDGTSKHMRLLAITAAGAVLRRAAWLLGGTSSALRATTPLTTLRARKISPPARFCFALAVPPASRTSPATGPRLRLRPAFALRAPARLGRFGFASRSRNRGGRACVPGLRPVASRRRSPGLRPPVGVLAGRASSSFLTMKLSKKRGLRTRPANPPPAPPIGGRASGLRPPALRAETSPPPTLPVLPPIRQQEMGQAAARTAATRSAAVGL
jgi:hypothetical protein